MYGPGGRGHGLGLRYRRPSTTCARASGCPGFFACMGNFESPHSVSNWWITFRLPFVINVFSRISSAFSSWRLQNCAVFHIFSSTANHLSSQRLLGPCETSRWVGQTGGGVLLHCWYVFSFSFLFLLTSRNLLQPSHHTLPSLPTDMAAFSLEGPPGPTTDCVDNDDA